MGKRRFSLGVATKAAKGDKVPVIGRPKMKTRRSCGILHEKVIAIVDFLTFMYYTCLILE